MRPKRIIAIIATPLLIAAGMAASPSGPASAYGGDGAMNVYQIGISFNCNNKALCGSDAGGFWGWGELDENVSTGAHTGDGEFTFCGHNGQASGAGHESADVTNWWTAPGSAGPNTLFTDEVDTITYRGQTQVETVYGQDAGIALVPGHTSAASIFGIKPPPGMAIQIQIAYKPAH